jgi:hypothetical protein
MFPRIVFWTVLSLSTPLVAVATIDGLLSTQQLQDEFHSEHQRLYDTDVQGKKHHQHQRQLGGAVQYCRCEASWEKIYEGRRRLQYDYDSASLDYQGFVIIEGVRVIPKIADQCNGSGKSSGSSSEYRGNSHPSSSTSTTDTRSETSPLTLNITRSAEELKEALATFDFGTGTRKADVDDAVTTTVTTDKNIDELRDMFKDLGKNRRLNERQLMMGGSKGSKGSKGFYYGYNNEYGKGKGGDGFYYDSRGYAQGKNNTRYSFCFVSLVF